MAVGYWYLLSAAAVVAVAAGCCGALLPLMLLV